MSVTAARVSAASSGSIDPRAPRSTQQADDPPGALGVAPLALR